MKNILGWGRLWFQNHKATLLVVWGLVVLFGKDALDVYQKTGGHISKTDIRAIAIAIILGYMRSVFDKATIVTVATPTTTITKEVTTDSAADTPLDRP